MRPFRQLDFERVPQEPRKKHPYFESAIRNVRVQSRSFGEYQSHVRIFGKGPPLVLIHGFMTTSYSWRYLFDELRDRYTMYAFDLVGAGASDKPDRPYSAEAMAETIGATLRALDLWGAPVIGNSLGGYLAMRLALEEPDSMRCLVNLHSPGLPTFRNHALRAAMHWIPGADSIVKRLVRIDAKKWVHRNVHYYDESLKSREEHDQYAAPLETAEGVHAFARMLRETFDPAAMVEFERKLRALNGEFPVPLLLAYAPRDPMVPPEIGTRMKALLPNASFEWLEDASHFAHVDATERFAALADVFLRQHLGP